MPPAKISKDGAKLTNKSLKSGKIKKKNDIFQTIRKQNIQFLKRNLETENIETVKKLKKVKEELDENETAMNCVICWESKVCYFFKAFNFSI